LSPFPAVHVRFTKWGDRPHWEYDCVIIGDDEHGVWAAGMQGTHMSRPGFAFDTGAPFVQCFPRSRGYAATFWPVGAPSQPALYVDITTPPVWSGVGTELAEVRMVDLDLDVILNADSELLVDDEDEFADHQVRFGYPSDVIASAEAECDRVYAEIERGAEPYGTVGRSWLRRFEQSVT
jgi:hypothetical protein